MGVNVKEQLKMMGPRGEIVIEDFDEFAARRRLDNIAHNMSECNFSRQTDVPQGCFSKQCEFRKILMSAWFAIPTPVASRKREYMEKFVR